MKNTKENESFYYVTVKSTGERELVSKEPEWSLFRGFYRNLGGTMFYEEDEIEEKENISKSLTITLSDKETCDYDNFCEEHSHDDICFGAIGGKHSLVLTGTGLGWVICAKCNVCKETKDITDISTW